MRVIARGISLVAVMSMLLAALTIAPAFAQEDPQENPYEETGATGEAEGPESVPPGGEATFFAGGFEAGAEIIVTLFGVLSETATVTADSSGVASYTVTVPCDAESGEATITFEGAGEDAAARTVSTEFTVTADESAACPATDDDGVAGAPEADGGLAATGGEFTNGAMLAVVVLIAGAGLLVLGRRRSRESADV